MATLSELQEAVGVVRTSPQQDSAWRRALALASQLDRPDDIIEAFRDVVALPLAPEVAEAVGQRAAAFCDEWFGDEPDIIEGILQRVFALAPQSDFPLQRLSVLYTVAERWPDLLSLYDRALALITDKDRRIKLLREAAQLAKDVANLPDKAISYQQALLPLTPEDSQLALSLERLLERHERWSDLVTLWESRLDTLNRGDRDKSRARMTEVCLTNLRDGARALHSVRPMLTGADADSWADREACALLDRIIDAPFSNRTVRDGALDLLRSHYDANGRPRDVIAVMQRVIDLDPAGSRALREEAGNRLSDLDEVPAAMDQYAALLAMVPTSVAVEERLRQLADRGNDWDRYARGVAQAARQCDDATRAAELLSRGAAIRWDRLQQLDGAITLYEEALAQTAAADAELLKVTRALAQLYKRAEREPERLNVLERQAGLEPTAATKADIYGLAAKLAEQLGQADRALTLWERRAASDPSDISGVDARVVLLESQGRWDDLVAALNERADKRGPESNKADLIAIARVHEEKRKDLPAAIATWQRIIENDPADSNAITAVTDLLAKTSRWAEFADVMGDAVAEEGNRAVLRYVRLGDALARHLTQPNAAARAYRNALAIMPGHEPALRGMKALLEFPETRGMAADTLAAAYQRRGDIAAVLELLPARLAEVRRPDQRDARTELALLREAAQLRLQHLGEAGRPAAIADLAAAFPLAPRDQLLENQLVELAHAKGATAALAAAYEAALDALEDAGAVAADPDVLRLRFAHAELLAGLQERERAANLYFEVQNVTPANARATSGVIKLGAELGRWTQVAMALLEYAVVTEKFDDAMWKMALDGALAKHAVQAFAHSVGEGLAAIAVPGPVAGRFRYQLGGVYRDYCREPELAIKELRRALELVGERASWLHELVELESKQPRGKALLDALRRLAAAEPNNLDAFVDSAGLANELGEQEAAVALWNEVVAKAMASWRTRNPLVTRKAPDAVILQATDALVTLHCNAKRYRLAMDTLVDVSRLPYKPEQQRALRLRAADIAGGPLGDRVAAIDMYRVALEAMAEDPETLTKMADLLVAEDRVSELLLARRAQLGLQKDPEAKLALRLDIATLVGVVEARGGRLQALLDNLAERPGHDASIDAVAALLSAKVQFGELANLLEKQAQEVEAAGNPERAAQLWTRFAEVTERHTREMERAILGHRRVVALVPNTDSLRALARLYTERNQPAQSVPWLESLLRSVPSNERGPVVQQLAKAHLAAKQADRAILAIEQFLSPTEPAVEVRGMLADLYRQTEAWEPLARHLTRSLPVLSEAHRRTAAREAAAIYVDKMKQPERAIPALQAALALDPTDKELRTQLAVGLRVSGKLVEARATLNDLINEYGRRRSADRAVLHVELARVARAEDKLDEAINEMDQAAKMDAGNAEIQKEMAELCRLAGQLDKAERTYRSLLLLVRRQPPGDNEAETGQSEVLFELHKLAAQRGDSEQANELLESAIDAGGQSDAEVRRLRRSLVAHNEGKILLGVLESRLRANAIPANQAYLLADMADVLVSLERHDDALDAVLRAMSLAPTTFTLHAKARTLAKAAKRTRDYVSAAEALSEKLRRKDDPPLIAEALLRAGHALEEDVADLAAAQAMYEKVENLGERLSDSYLAQARVAALLGDQAGQNRALDKMFDLAGAFTDSDELSSLQVDALYHLSSVFVSTPTRRTVGIDLLERAFAAEPRWAQAGRILRTAAATELSETDERVLRMYERVARASGDSEMLMDFLERRALREGASPAHVREAIDTAFNQGQEDRALSLLEAAVDNARATVAGVASDEWATLTLADKRMAAGQLHAARDLIYEIAPSADGKRVDALGLQLAERAVSRKDRALANDVYEFLRERRPADPAVWQPLLAMYRESKEPDRFAAVVVSTLPHLESDRERAALRLSQANFLIETLGQAHDALDVLRAGLQDAPDDLALASCYEATLRQLGDDDALVEFLWQRFDQAQRRGHRESTIDAALHLGTLLEAQQSADIGRVYRAALIVAPDDREILRRVVQHMREDDDPREAAILMERLLSVETPENAPDLSEKVAEMWRAAGDARAVQRTLETAHRTAPAHKGIHDKLARHYREHQMWNELAELMIADAERLPDAEAVDKLREAATVYSGNLGLPRRAAEVLQLARARSSDGDSLVTDQAAALAAAGDLDGAQRALADALGQVKGPQRFSLLMLRASFQQQLGDELGACATCQEAYELDHSRGLEPLLAALERLRQRATAAADGDNERSTTLRLAALCLRHAQPERARALLTAWIARQPDDTDALETLVDLDASLAHWDGVFAGASRLALIASGEKQVAAALRAAHAATDAGKAAEALPLLEAVYEAQPSAVAVRAALRAQYESQGAFRQLAQILTTEADQETERDARFANYKRAAELWLYTLEDPNAATYAAGKALELTPDDHGVLMLNVDILIAAGQLEDAHRTLDAAISAQKKRTPELAVMQQKIGRIAALLGDRDGQLNWLKKAFDVDRKNGEVAAELAQLATELGDYELALKPLRAITLMENPFPVTRPMALLWEAKIEHARGNRAKAELWAKKALREDPAFHEAVAFIEELGGTV